MLGLVAEAADAVSACWGSGGLPPEEHSTRHPTPEAGREFYADVKGRLARYGRAPGDLKIMPGVTYVLGDTDADAQEAAAEIRRQQVSPQNALLALERIWGRDLSGHDPDGPLPDIDPDPDSALVQGRVRVDDPVAVARKWRALSEAKGLSIRQTVIEATGRQSFVGSPATVAAALEEFVATDAAGRLHPRPAPRPRRPRRLRRPGRPAAPGARGLPHGVHGHHAALAPRPSRSRMER